jgi:endonuclease/exonuclease/phosphatase family metal-dependent hydrolase
VHTNSATFQCPPHCVAHNERLEAQKMKVRVMTFNVANYHDHKQWAKRRKLIANLIKGEQADIVSLQELRNDDELEEELQGRKDLPGEPRGMLAQLLAELEAVGVRCQHRISKSHVYNAETDFWEGKVRSAEPVPSPPLLVTITRRSLARVGQAVLVCNPAWDIDSDEILELSKPGSSGDQNRRTAQLLQLSAAAPDGSGRRHRVGVVNVHFSYDTSEYKQNIQQVRGCVAAL